MNNPKNILIVDDDPLFRVMLESFLGKKKFKTQSTGTAKDTLKILKTNSFDLILIDLRLPDGNGLDLLKTIKNDYINIPLILMTSYVDIKTAVKAIKSGAFEYITKPVNTEELEDAISNAFKTKDLKENKKTKSTGYFGSSKASLSLVENINIIAPTNLSVLILGESGTGKEYVARQIHEKSKRNNMPFLAIDCGVLGPELAASELFGHIKGAFTGAHTDKAGYFETANGGTLFLDEIGNLSIEVQASLLRAIQERKIKRLGTSKEIDLDIRIIAATNEDLKKGINKGMFREDLYHRLNEFSLEIPPLRDKKEDVIGFADLFLQQANEELSKSVNGFSEDVINVFSNYHWPGNLRELKNIVKRSVLLTPSGEPINVKVLPQEMVSHDSSDSNFQVSEYDLKAAANSQEKEYILKVLEKVNFNKSSAAKLLNIDRKTLYNKLKQFNINI